MKIPETFILRISTNNLGIVSTNSFGRKIKDLFDKVPVEFSFAKSLYSGGRYSYENKFIARVEERKNYEEKTIEIIIRFKKLSNKK